LTLSGVPGGSWGSALSFGSGLFTFSAQNSTGTTITQTYTAPVTITSSDATGAVKLSVNGGTPAKSVQVSAGSEQVGIVYSGAAVNPVTISASPIPVSTGAPSYTAIFSPTTASILYSGPTNASTGLPEIDLYATNGTGSQFQFTASQRGYTGSFGFSILGSAQPACSSFATIGNSNGASGTTFTITAISNPAPGTCTLTLSGFSGSGTVTVTLTYSTLGVTLQ
jgi:hypothetical protein